jgi:hypothetical protein
MTSTFVRVTLAAAIAFAVSFAVACGGEQEPAPDQAEAPAPPPTTPDVVPPSAAAPAPPPAPDMPGKLTIEEEDADGNPVRFSGTDPQGKAFSASIGDSVTIPGPIEDLPRYPGASPMSALNSAGEDAIATFRSNADQQEIYDFYVEELTSGGWSIGKERTFGGQRSFEATNGGRKVSISITGTDGDSRISVVTTGAG